jgi:hypothetical protein
LVLLVLLSGLGCNTECRSLCTTWYDYLRDVCVELDTDDDRVRCISDYRASRVSTAELDQCKEQAEHVADLDEAEDDLLCPRETDPDDDDDDSSR